MIPPDGFVEAEGRGPFTRHNGPIYRRRQSDQIQVGMYILERHCNGLGFLHGGMAASFADGALAWAVWEASNLSSVTMRLSIDYLQPVRQGDWLMAEPKCLQIDGDVVHVEATLTRNERSPVCHAAGVFHLLRRKMN